jgi:pyruvate,water dikinase
MKTLERASHAGVFTMPLGAVRLKDLPCAGGKAAHLGEMIAAGLPVPAGFVVTTDACKRFMQSDPRIGDWLERLEGCDARDPAALRAAAEEVRRQLSAIPLPGEVADAIAAAMAPEPGGARAVRSSATVEDLPEASFAGQHDSFLNVPGGEAVLGAVKRCWLSLFSERAISYRMRKGVAPGRAQMAVIVQQLIDADAAGVMFTKDPAGGDSDSIFIEAAFGLGEAVVQGKVAPDRVEVSRSGLRVVRRDTGLKRMQIVAAKEGVCEQLLAAEKAGAPVLEDETASRLAGLGLEVERVLGGPLDIEWGVRGKEIWLLQARAVTALQQGRGTSFEERQVWTNANAGEALPDVVTPMTWSLVQSLIGYLLDSLFRDCGFRMKHEQAIGLIAGRVYFNFNTMCALGRLGRHVPGLRNRSMESLLGGHQDTMIALKQIRISEADLPRIEIRRWKAAVRLPVVMLHFLFYSPRRGRAVVDKIRRINEDLARVEPGSLSDGELLAAIRGSFAPEAMIGFNVIGELLGAVGFFFFYNLLLFNLCEQWFAPEGRSTANRLLAGVGGLDDAAAGHELWLLAEEAAREPEIKSVLLGERTFPAFASRLEGCRGGRAFRERWDAFMHRRGHHARGELELFAPRWSECPDLVLDMVRGYVEAINAGHPGPIVRQEALAGERVALANRCVGGLKNPLKRAIFPFVLYRAQQGGGVRENLKSELIRFFAFLRRFLLEMGRRLAARGRLADENDMFFLEIEELQSGSLLEPGTDLRALIAGRRALYEQNVKITPPAVIVGRFDPRTFVPEAVDRGTKVFHGLGVSAGTVTGRARVILRSDANERVQPGEILVAPFTDPGWTPYFVAAAGIVMDLGGMLSHGSIVAREYGIPAVVNVGPATQIIRTGQWIEVDADRGVVRVLDAAPDTGDVARESGCS